MLIASRVIDRHNELSGLSNDDHPQYVHTTIQRTITSSPIFSSASSSAISLNIKRISGQTGRLLNIISESDSDLANIDANGNLFVAGTISGTLDVSNLTGLISTSVLGTGTANSGTFLRGDNTWSSSLNSGTIISPNPFILSQTWNNSGSLFSLLQLDVTNTASNSSSYFIRARKDLAEYFTVDIAGNIVCSGNINPSGAIQRFNTVLDIQNQSLSAANLIHTRFSNATFGHSSGTAVAVQISPTINQSSSAGYTGLKIAITESATGSGTKSFIDCQLGGVVKFNVSKTGVITGDGSLITNIPYSALTSTPTIDTLVPSQTGNSGKFLTTNGSAVSWGTVISYSDPLSTLGDTLYRDVSSTTRLAGNTTTTKKYLSQTGNGTISAAPIWSQPAASELSDYSNLALLNANNSFTGQNTFAAGTITTSLPLTISQTWNAAATFLGLVLDVTSTQSNATSRILQVKVGGSETAAIDRSGRFIWHSGSAAAPSYSFLSESSLGMYRVGSGVVGIASGGVLQAQFGGTGATLTLQDATASTGVTKMIVKAGAGQSTTNLEEWQNNSGTVLTQIQSTGLIRNTTGHRVSGGGIGAGNYADFTHDNVNAKIVVNGAGTTGGGLSIEPSTNTDTGTATNLKAVTIARTYNQASGTPGGTDLKIVRTETAVLGTHRLIDCYAGVSGTTNVFVVGNTGNIRSSANGTTGFWLKNSGDTLQVRNAADTFYATVEADTYRLNNGVNGLWQSSSLNIRSDAQFTISSTTNGTVAGDVGIARSAAGSLKVTDGSSGTGSITASDFIGITETIGIEVDGNGGVISTGTKSFRYIDHNYTITGWEIICDQSGSVTFSVGTISYASYDGSTSSSIVASDPPIVSSAIKNNGSSLTGWTTTLTAGDYISFGISSASTVTKATLYLKVTRR